VAGLGENTQTFQNIRQNIPREWLKQFETKPDNEPGRYEVPADCLEEFNSRVKQITAIQRTRKR
jgi:hypothetical protein